MYFRDILPTDTSYLEIIILSLGTFGAIYLVWKAYQYLFGKPNIEIHVADSVDLVIGVDRIINNFHLGCTFDNKGTKTGVVQYIDAKVVDPDSHEGRFKWEIFVQYDKESHSLERIPLSFRQAIAVRPRDIEFNLIQFTREGTDNSKFDWMVGNYNFEIRLWVNKKSRNKAPSVTTRFLATVGENFIDYVNLQRERPNYFTLDVPDWLPPPWWQFWK